MKELVICLLTLSLFLVGCANVSQPINGDNSGIASSDKLQAEKQNSTEWNVSITEMGWPDSDLAVRKLVNADSLLFPNDYELDGATIRRFVGTTDKNYENSRSFVQELAPPYTEWIITEMPFTWEEEGQKYGIGYYLFYDDRPIHATIAELGVAHSSYYWATCNEKGEIEKKLEKIQDNMVPESYTRLYELVNPDTIFSFRKMDNMLYQFSKDLQLEKEIKLPGQIESIAKDGNNEQIYICGHDDTSFVIWDLAGEEVVKNADKLRSYEYQAGVLSSGEFVLCDEQKLWVCDKKGNVALVYDFVLNDYPWELIYDIEVQADDRILILGVLDGMYVPILVDLNSEQARESEKQEIVIAFGYTHKALLKSISRFNRQSNKYHISAITAGDGTMDAFRRRIQSQISAGGGPDILGDDFLKDISGYIDNGYFASLDGVIKEEEYLKAAIEGGKVEGNLYGLPYDFILRFVTYSQEFTGSRNAWTMEELMEAVESSGASQLEFACKPIDIIMWYGLYDNENKDYIDWEKKESHLSEEPFKRLLKFALKYGDKEHNGINRSEEGELLLNKENVATLSQMDDLMELGSLKVCFEGKPAHLGYPRENGRGIYAQSRYLYMNANSDKKEGIKEFFQFLLTKEEQQKYCKMEIFMSGWEGYKPYLPVNLETLEYLIECSCNLKESEKRQHGLDGRGVTFKDENLSDEQIDALHGLLEDALPDKFYATEIYNMVSEELEPFFAGQRSMEEAVRILDNRVQLYLDEQK